MKRRALLALLPGALLLTAFQSGSVRKIVVWKGERRMELLDASGVVLTTYKIALGFAPAGHKTQEGDGKTPEGLYKISDRSPNSAFHRSLRIDYPNDADRAQAKARGVSPGGDIFINGQPNSPISGGPLKISYDWTAGCIAVGDNEIEDIWRRVANGTAIDIRP